MNGGKIQEYSLSRRVHTTFCYILLFSSSKHLLKREYRHILIFEDSEKCLLHIILLRRLPEDGVLKRHRAKNKEDVDQEKQAKRRTWNKMVSSKILHHISFQLAGSGCFQPCHVIAQNINLFRKNHTNYYTICIIFLATNHQCVNWHGKKLELQLNRLRKTFLYICMLFAQ